MSSNILGAYKKFRQIEKKADLEKRRKFETEMLQKYNVEITEANVYKQNSSFKNSPVSKQ